ncbi:hypothetical protein [Pedobacter sp. R20-19]|uniref:hypothetical protein n=1 Tax=Pedobacter sp. R20-19 TaxID=1270196 RepID=UPI000493A800|nr:hypothetical protein [Pedobacter sp. R20-19]
MTRNGLANFNDLSKDFEIISKLENANIIGGGVDLDALFTQIFDFSATNLNAATIAMFKKEVTDLASTTVGDNLLQSLLTAGNKIFVTNEKPTEAGAFGGYGFSNNTLQLGSLDPDTNTEVLNSLAFSSIAHELYHAYQDNVTYGNNQSAASEAYRTDAKTEIDAGIFSYMAAIEYDINHNLAYDSGESHARQSFSLESGNPNTAAKAAFDKAWQETFLQGFTKENYNALIRNFKEGSSYTVSKTTSTEVQDLNETFIDNLFNTGFSSEIKLWKAINDNTGATPNQLISADSTLHAPINVGTDSGSNGSNGSGDGGDPYNGSGSGGMDSGYSPWITSGSYDPNYGYSSNNGDYWFTSPATGMPQNSGWESGNNGGPVGPNNIPWWYYLSNDSSSW